MALSHSSSTPEPSPNPMAVGGVEVALNLDGKEVSLLSVGSPVNWVEARFATKIKEGFTPGLLFDPERSSVS